MAERTWPALVVRAGATGWPLSPSDDADALQALLDDFGPIAIEDVMPLPLPPGGLWDPTFPPPPEPPPAPLHWQVFFDRASDRDAAHTALARASADLDLQPLDIADADWAARSQRALTAVRAGAVLVAPPWDVPAAVPADVTLVVIEPSRGFGTGHHASTRLCLHALSTLTVDGLDVLDLGTGSGVLAMAAALRGAHSVVAVDIDQDAIDSAIESAALNPGVSGVSWLVADFRDPAVLGMRQWPLVIGNLTGGMLRSAAGVIDRLVADGGRLIVSGFDNDEAPEVIAALGREVEHRVGEDGWVGLVLGQRRHLSGHEEAT